MSTQCIFAFDSPLFPYSVIFDSDLNPTLFIGRAQNRIDDALSLCAVRKRRIERIAYSRYSADECLLLCQIVFLRDGLGARFIILRIPFTRTDRQDLRIVEIERDILSLTRQIIFLLPLIVIFPRFWGIEGIMYAAPIADLMAALVSGATLLRELRSMGKESQVIL